MSYITPDGEWPRYAGDVKIAHPSWKEGLPLPQGWHFVEEIEVPTIGEDEIVYQDFPIFENNTYKENWIVREMTAEEIAKRDAPKILKQKLTDLGITQEEIDMIRSGVIL